MAWTVEFADEFEPEFDALAAAVQDELLAQARVLERFGPATRRPRVDTLNGSRYFYQRLIRVADQRFDAHLTRLKRK